MCVRADEVICTGTKEPAQVLASQVILEGGEGTALAEVLLHAVSLVVRVAVFSPSPDKAERMGFRGQRICPRPEGSHTGRKATGLGLGHIYIPLESSIHVFSAVRSHTVTQDFFR